MVREVHFYRMEPHFSRSSLPKTSTTVTLANCTMNQKRETQQGYCLPAWVVVPELRDRILPVHSTPRLQLVCQEDARSLIQKQLAHGPTMTQYSPKDELQRTNPYPLGGRTRWKIQSIKATPHALVRSLSHLGERTRQAAVHKHKKSLRRKRNTNWSNGTLALSQRKACSTKCLRTRVLYIFLRSCYFF